MLTERTRKILITGGAGFIGSHVVRLFVTKYPHYKIFNLDKLTYAGNLENIEDVENASNYQFIRADVADRPFIETLFSQESFDGVIHLAASSHVDRSIDNPHEFAHTNVIGTLTLLNAATKAWQGDVCKRFYHISTDEVYGSLSKEGVFKESSPINPRSPYAASKAGSDHFVNAFYNSYDLPILISRCSNNYGPYQFPEKFVPLVLHNIMTEQPIPIYGKGENIRDWLYVEDHARAIDIIFHQGKTGEVYNVGANNEWRNIDLGRLLCRMCDERLGNPNGHSEQLIQSVKDRPGHDFRYALNSNKLMQTLGWKPSLSFDEGLKKTIDWHIAHRSWMNRIKSGQYRLNNEKKCEK